MLFSIELTAVHYRLEHLSGAFVAVTYGLALVAVGVRPLLSSALGGTDPLSLFSTAFVDFARAATRSTATKSISHVWSTK